MRIQPNSKLVMIGDSITDCGRTQPVGEGLFEAQGKGYVSFVNALLTAAVPQHAIRVVNMGNSGNTVRDLKARWDRDVLALEPDWLSIMIGINDVWRHFDMPLFPENHVSEKEYAETLKELVLRTRPKLKGLVLISPYFIEPNRGDAMRAKMDRHTAIVRSLAAESDAVFVDVQAAFDEALAHMHPMNLAWDRVHPTTTGHMLIAKAFLKGVGFAW